jgi:hypothetical protein|tara:strand:- start:373 stop:585 length:213 start_codon:yes stop_codon:yes gene_type:complete
MGYKDEALAALEKVIVEYELAPSAVGREIAGDPGFMTRLRNPDKTISTNTLDKVWRFILKKRGQLDLDLD